MPTHNSKITIYFGPARDLPPDIQEIPLAYRQLGVRDFPEAAKKLKGKYWTNNPYWLDEFLPDNIVLILEEGHVLLSETSDYKEQRSIFNNGEIAADVRSRNGTPRMDRT